MTVRASVARDASRRAVRLVRVLREARLTKITRCWVAFDFMRFSEFGAQGYSHAVPYGTAASRKKERGSYAASTLGRSRR